MVHTFPRQEGQQAGTRCIPLFGSCFAFTMATDICVRRLTKELKALKKDPIKDPKITVAPNESNILEMHYVIEGSKGTPYEGGVYHGKLVFPKEYPLRPPGVLMLTPSGRFQPNRRLCLSMSDVSAPSAPLLCANPSLQVSDPFSSLLSLLVTNSITQSPGVPCGLCRLF